MLKFGSLFSDKGGKMIEIIEDETQGKFCELKCENCGEIRLARHIQVVGMFRLPRGSYIICFKCFGPVVRWRDDRNIMFESPAASSYRIQNA